MTPGEWFGGLTLRGGLVCSLFFVACAAPPIPPVEAGAVLKTERAAREVELCVLYQETDERPAWQGVVGGGGERWQYAIASVAVKHPAGLLIIDPAFGESIGSDLARAGPVFTTVMGSTRTKTPLTEAMRRAGLQPADARFAVVTHGHWDHTGALGDLPHARVLVARRELEWVTPFTRFMDEGAMPHHFKRAKARLYAFDFSGPPIDGFEASFDLFGDGAVVAVPLPGHTPGSTAFLVRGQGGVTWLFSGDTTWTSLGVQRPAHKTLRAFDSDLSALSASIGRLHAFRAHRPDVKVVPAHDGAALGQLPTCREP